LHTVREGGGKGTHDAGWFAPLTRATVESKKAGRGDESRTAGRGLTCALWFQASAAAVRDLALLGTIMKATAEIQVIPMGVGVSVRNEVKRAHQLLVDSGLNVELHAFGTNVEGELDDILAAIRNVHETLHREGIVRISTAVKIGTRTDKDTTLAGKRF
jgi:uncharacterized protein (TIGR00106 family)